MPLAELERENIVKNVIARSGALAGELRSILGDGPELAFMLTLVAMRLLSIAAPIENIETIVRIALEQHRALFLPESLS